MPENKSDQSDVIAQNAQLTTQIASLTAQLTAQTAKVTALEGDNKVLAADKAALTAQLETANTKVTAITKERDDLKAENTTLKANAQTVEQAAAAKVAAMGISGKTEKEKAEDGKGGKEANAKPSWTDRILKAKGCSSLDELAEKSQQNRNR